MDIETENSWGWISHRRIEHLVTNGDFRGRPILVRSTRVRVVALPSCQVDLSVIEPKASIDEALAPRNQNAQTPVRPQLAESQGHVFSMRGVPINQGTSATGAVAWGGVGRLIDPQISKSTGRDWKLLSIITP